MIVSASEVTIVTFPANAPDTTYQSSDIDFLKNNLTGIQSIGQAFVSYEGEYAVAVVGLDASNNPILGDSGLVALPCPPYCGKDGSPQRVDFQTALGNF
ncbi:MAG: hypothetical protein WA004_10180 [Saprospiraceae bacterium]